jgi:uncharacterized protein (UPF0333 family)
MFSAILWFLIGVICTVIVGFFVWKNNKKKWEEAVATAEAKVAEYEDKVKAKVKK